jgi:hypothetical protein
VAKKGFKPLPLSSNYLWSETAKKRKRQNEMGGTSRVATYHDKDVLGVEVKRDVP